MRIKIKAPQRNSRTTFRQSEIDRMKEDLANFKSKGPGRGVKIPTI